MFRNRLLSALLAVALVAGVVVSSHLTSANAAIAPSFTNFAAPGGLGTDAGEPSIGVNPRTGRVMFQAGFQTLQVTVGNGTASWKDVAPLVTRILSLDPILYTDQGTGRTFVSQLDGVCSLMAYTDTDGEPVALGKTNTGWVQNPLGCGAGTAADHQSVGGGAYAAPLTGGTPIYKDSVFYCAQAIAGALCARSDDGGISFGPGVPMYTAATCGGLHGHLKAAPDGTVYVPNASCSSSVTTRTLLNGPRQGVAYSSDNGTTWKVSLVPDSSTQNESDPSVAVGKAGSVYFGYADGKGQPRVSVGRKQADGSMTWRPSTIVNPRIHNTQFPTMVAGDDDRASVAYLGTTTSGNDQAPDFPGEWHLYVSTTYDGGATWTTTDATPSDPVQRGCIWLGGGDNPCRNLLDFMDATLDATGHIVVGYADGCIGDCVNGGANGHSSLATIAYQTGGDALYATPSPTTSSTSTTTTLATTTTTSSTTTTTPAATVGAPTLSGRTATGKQAGTRLSWTVPSSTSPITGYQVFRGTTAGSEGSTPLATVGGSVTTYSDTATTKGVVYYYVVRAVAGSTTGPASNEVAVTAA